jgi:transcriptional regulator with XRE-family HTH domain
MVSPFGQSLKHWRKLRGLSQLDLAHQAGVGPRHLSFLESGRSRPGRDVVLRLCDALDLALRDRNALLETAGLAAAYPQTPLQDQALKPFRQIVRQLLQRHDPFPAFALDRWWNVVDANVSAERLFPGLRALDAEAALALFFGPGPQRQALVNWSEVAHAGLERLRTESRALGHPPELTRLTQRLEGWLAGTPRPPPRADTGALVSCPILRVGSRQIRTVSTIVQFGSAQDVTLQELRVELLFPADPESEEALRELLGV